MKCPNCQNELRPWPWQDGGYKGLTCAACDIHWWSDEFAFKAAKTEQLAIEWLLEREEFPNDAKNNVDQESLWLTLKEGDVIDDT